MKHVLSLLTTYRLLQHKISNQQLKYSINHYTGSLPIKPVFHFNRIVAKRSVFLCFLTTRVELMTSTQKKMLRYVTVEVKTGLIELLNFFVLRI
jgi:trehalose-6-phosphate synthase